MVRSNLYVLTGGPGVGKSTIATRLKQKGYTVIDEQAREYIADIKNGDAAGALPEDDPQRFNEGLVQRMRNTYHSYLPDASDVVLDRSHGDVFAYAAVFNFSPPRLAYKLWERFPLRAAFILDPLESYRKDSARWENKELAQEIHTTLEETYRQKGVSVINVPVFSSNKEQSIDQRTQFILSHMD